MINQNLNRHNSLARTLQREIKIIVPLRILLGLVFWGAVLTTRHYQYLGPVISWALSLPIHYYLLRQASAESITLITQGFTAFDSLATLLLALVMPEIVHLVLLFIPIAMLRSAFSGIHPRYFWLQGIPGTVMVLIVGLRTGEVFYVVMAEVLLIWIICWMVSRLAAEYQQMIEKIGRDSERLRYLAHTDSLTGLANHRYFLEVAEEAISQGQRFAIIFVDVDDFKKFNETRGHLRGDQVLTKVSDHIRQTVRSTDLVARYGGEEFLILARNSGIREVQAMANRLRESVANSCGVTLSIGIATYPEHGDTVEAVIAAADIAMYYSKRSGKNRVSYLEDLMDFFFCADLEPDVARAVSPLLTWLHYRHPETVEHARGVKKLVQQFSRWAGLHEKEANLLIKASLVHDLGKGEISVEVLNKSGPLTKEEWELIREHPALGVAIISEVDLLQDVIEIVRHHHEYWDGSGYPDGLAGESIPELARIMAVADAYEAMTRVRPYRPALSAEQAIAQLEAESGRHYDPKIVQKFVRFIRESVSVAS